MYTEVYRARSVVYRYSSMQKIHKYTEVYTRYSSIQRYTEPCENEGLAITTTSLRMEMEVMMMRTVLYL